MLKPMSFRTARAKFADLIAPVEISHFLNAYWQKRLLVVDDRREDAFANLLTLDDIDELLSSTAIPINQVDIGTKAVGIPKSQFQHGKYADPNEVLKLHRKGHSIILRAMDNWIPGLRELTMDASKFFNSGATANIYITPPGQQSSTPHWDAHDIFALQLHGTKVWDIHETLLPLPHPSYEFDARIHPVGSKTGEISISEGQCAYIPRGCVHNPHAETYSIHIALGVQVRTVDDALHRLLRRCSENNPELRHALPVHDGNFDRERSGDEVRKALLWLADECEQNLDAILDEIARTNREHDRPNCRNVLNRIALPESVELDTYLGLEAALSDADPSCYTINGIRYNKGTALDEAFGFLLSQSEFRVAEIPLSDDEMKVAFSERLLGDGVARLLE